MLFLFGQLQLVSNNFDFVRLAASKFSSHNGAWAGQLNLIATNYYNDTDSVHERKCTTTAGLNQHRTRHYIIRVSEHTRPQSMATTTTTAPTHSSRRPRVSYDSIDIELLRAKLMIEPSVVLLPPPPVTESNKH